MKQIREVRVKDLTVYFWLQLIILSATIATYIIITVLNVTPFNPLYLLPALLIIDYVPLKCFLIGCVLMYKAYAPMDVRNQCRFEPTCSTYMIMAIRKYGIIIGVTKGINRIFRCKPPNGGEDYP